MQLLFQCCAVVTWQDGDVVRYFPTHGDVIHVPDPEMHLVSLYVISSSQLFALSSLEWNI